MISFTKLLVAFSVTMLLGCAGTSSILDVTASSPIIVNKSSRNPRDISACILGKLDGAKWYMDFHPIVTQRDLVVEQQLVMRDDAGYVMGIFRIQTESIGTTVTAYHSKYEYFGAFWRERYIETQRSAVLACS